MEAEWLQELLGTFDPMDQSALRSFELVYRCARFNKIPTSRRVVDVANNR